jgi:hypothetical protein
MSTPPVEPPAVVPVCRERDKLKALGLYEKTNVFVLSDHGSPSTTMRST